MTKPALRPCRSGLHEYDHTRHRQCPECRRKAERKYRLTPKGKERFSPAQWTRAILNYRNGKPYRIVYIEPTPDGRDVKTTMFETVFTFHD